MNLKNEREKKGMSQSELAEKCGVVRQTISNIECGRAKPSVELAQKIAWQFDFHWTEFFNNEEGD